jgi:hypothetical protein
MLTYADVCCRRMHGQSARIGEADSNLAEKSSASALKEV